MAGQDAAAYAGPDEGEPVDQAMPPAAKLASFLAIPNLVTELEDEELSEISDKAITGYKIDLASCQDWIDRNEEGIKLATLLTDEEKDYPFKGAANVKYPLIAVGALQFNARASGAIMQGDRICKCKVNGHDTDGQKAKRAERVSEYQSWQLTSQDKNWTEDTDRMTLQIAIMGSMFRKRYYDPTLRKQCSRLLTPDRLIMNYRARSVEDVPRISERLSLYPYEIEERIRDGRFVEFDYGQAVADPNDPNAKEVDSNDDQAPHEFIEQHRLLDLDDDGYPEPYIVTVYLASQKVCRIVCNFDQESVQVTADGKIAAVRKRDYYVKYLFFPSADGGAYGMGFGSLLKSTNEAINTTLNELLDAGHLANTQSGFINGAAGMREKVFRLSRGELKVINTGGIPMNQAVSFVTWPGPSATLFTLLNLLIEQGKEVSSTKDVLTGDTGGKVMAPTTTLALIDQGMKVFNAIFKRIHAALGRELEMQADLNAKYLAADVYNKFFDDQEQFDPKADFDLETMDISPVSDPSVASEMQKLAKANVVREIAGGKPYFDQMEVDRRALQAAGVEDIDKLFVKADPNEAAFAEAMKKMTLLQLKVAIEKDETAAIKNLADAEAAEAGQQMTLYDFYLQSLNAQHGMEMDHAQAATGGPGDVSGMAGTDGNPAGAGPPQGPGDGAGAGLGGDAGGHDQQPGVGMGGPPAQPSPPAGAM